MYDSVLSWNILCYSYVQNFTCFAKFCSRLYCLVEAKGQKRTKRSKSLKHFVGAIGFIKIGKYRYFSYLVYACLILNRDIAIILAGGIRSCEVTRGRNRQLINMISQYRELHTVVAFEANSWKLSSREVWCSISVRIKLRSFFNMSWPFR